MASNSTFVRQLYQTALARDPDIAGSAYWTGELDKGFFTPAQVAYGFFSSGEYEQGVEAVSRLYFAAFKRMPDVAGVQFWMNIARQGANADQIATQFVNSPEFKQVNGTVGDNGALIDIFYSNVLNRSADPEGRSGWVSLLNQGVSAGNILNSFANSQEFQHKANGLVTNALAYYGIAGRAPTSAELASTPSDLASIVLGAVGKMASGTASSGATGLNYSGLTFSESMSNDGSISNTLTISLTGGDTFAGNIGATLGTVTGAPKGLNAKLTKTTDTTATFFLTDNATAHSATNSISNLKVVFAAKDFTSVATTGKVGLTQLLNVSFIEIPAYESAGELVLSGAASVSVKVDLLADKLFFGATAATLSSGTMANAVNVNAADITGSKITLTLIGDDAANKITASALGGTITGGKGADALVAGSGIDKFIFAGTAAENGVDVIENFTLGATSGDVLVFSAFLNKTGTANISPVSSSTVANKTWSNGDILVATGYNIDTAAKVASLFNAGSNAPYAAPAAASKLVVITADIVGDARIWYIVNQTSPTIIDSSEITLVGTLSGVNNLGLTGYGFAAGNFA